MKKLDENVAVQSNESFVLNVSVDQPIISDTETLQINETRCIETPTNFNETVDLNLDANDNNATYVDYQTDENIISESNQLTEIIQLNHVIVSTSENLNINNEVPVSNVILNDTIPIDEDTKNIDNLIDQSISSVNYIKTVSNYSSDTQSFENTIIVAPTNNKELIEEAPIVNETINNFNTNNNNENYVECEISKVKNESPKPVNETIANVSEISDNVKPSTSTPIAANEQLTTKPTKIVCTKNKIVIFDQTIDATPPTDVTDLDENSFPSRRLSIRQDLFPTSSGIMSPSKFDKDDQKEDEMMDISSESAMPIVSKKCSEFSDKTFKKPKLPSPLNNHRDDLKAFATLQAQQQNFGDEEFESNGSKFFLFCLFLFLLPSFLLYVYNLFLILVFFVF